MNNSTSIHKIINVLAHVAIIPSMWILIHNIIIANHITTYIIGIAIPLILNIAAIKKIKHQETRKIENITDIEKIKIIHYIPNTVTKIIAALVINEAIIIAIIITLIIFMKLMTNMPPANIIQKALGYNQYILTTWNNETIIIITKKNLKKTEDIDTSKEYYVIDNQTIIEK